MSKPCTLRQLGREWLIALAGYALLVAPFGCQIQTELLDPGGGSTGGQTTVPAVGLFINSDLASPVMAAGRNAAGDRFFVYGQRLPDGGIAEVSSILVQPAAGQESFIKFEQGRPVRLQGPDGSRLQITYDVLSPLHLVAHATAYAADGTEIASQTADIDLQRTAEQVAQAVQALTGQPLPVTTEAQVQNAAIQTSKLNQRGQGRFIAVVAALALVMFSQVLIQTSGQVFDVLFTGLGAAIRAVLMVIYVPVFLFAELLSEVVTSIFSTPLLRIFVYLPPAP